MITSPRFASGNHWRNVGRMPTHRETRSCLRRATSNEATIKYGYVDDFAPHEDLQRKCSWVSLYISRLGRRRIEHPSSPGGSSLGSYQRDKTERAYRRKDALEKRQALMEAWANHCGSQVPKKNCSDAGMRPPATPSRLPHQAA